MKEQERQHRRLCSKQSDVETCSLNLLKQIKQLARVLNLKYDVVSACTVPRFYEESELHEDGDNEEHNSFHKHAHQVTSDQIPLKRRTDLALFACKDTTSLTWTSNNNNNNNNNNNDDNNNNNNDDDDDDDDEQETQQDHAAKYMPWPKW